MSSAVYLLRDPVEQLSPCLYADADDGAVVIRLDQAVAQSSLQIAQIVKPGSLQSYRAGQVLTCVQLLDLLLHAPKIVTL